MEEQHKVNKYILIYLLIIILLSLILSLILIIFSLNSFLIILSVFVFSIIISYFITYIILKNDNEKKITSAEIINAKGTIDTDYFRDFFDNYSPSELSFIMKDQISEDSIYASLINLLNKNIIKIDENGIEIIDEYYKLKESETYIVKNYPIIIKYYVNNHCKDIFRNLILRKYRNIVINEMQKDNLVKITNNYDEIDMSDLFVKKSFNLNFYLINPLISCYIIYKIFTNSYNIYSLIDLVPLFFFTLYLFISYNNRNILVKERKKNKYIKTKEGMQLYKYLIGLKKYLIEFTNVPNESIEKIKLWDNYVIYSIIFNISGNLDKGASKEIIEYFKKYINYPRIHKRYLLLYLSKLSIITAIILFASLWILLVCGYGEETTISIVVNILHYIFIVSSLILWLASNGYKTGDLK